MHVRPPELNDRINKRAPDGDRGPFRSAMAGDQPPEAGFITQTPFFFS